MDQLEHNKTLGFILSTLLAIGNFLNGTNVSLVSQHFPGSFFLQKNRTQNHYENCNPLFILYQKSNLGNITCFYCVLGCSVLCVAFFSIIWRKCGAKQCNSLRCSVDVLHSKCENCVVGHCTADGLILGLVFSKLKINKSNKFPLLWDFSSFPCAPYWSSFLSTNLRGKE